MRQPGIDAIEAARTVARRLKDRAAAPVRRTFIERPAPDQTSPLARLLRGGRGGDVRLKLELSFLWFAAGPPHELSYPARAWASLLDLDKPETNGARRINEAIGWLETNNFIHVQGRVGQPNIVRLLSESGDGSPYELPGTAYNRLRNNQKAAEPHRYVQIPNEFWTNGYLAVLSGSAIAMFLILLNELRNQDPQKSVLWFSPQRADIRYGLSDDTRSKGLRELVQAGVADVRRQSIAPDSFDFKRLRNVYRLDLDHLKKSPAQVREKNEAITTHSLLAGKGLESRTTDPFR